MANEYGPYMDAANPDNEWTLRACVVRFAPGTVNSDGTFDTGGPYIHANSGHIAVGAQGVHIEADGDLVVDLDGGAISVILATPDETLTTRGIWFGPSGAAGTTTLRCYKVGTGKLDLSTQAGWDAVAGTLSNLWLFWATCTGRGSGEPSKADQALIAVAGMQAQIAAQGATIQAQAPTIADLDQRLQVIESLQVPGSFGRFDQAKAGQSLAGLDAEHAGDTFADFDAAHEPA